MAHEHKYLTVKEIADYFRRHSSTIIKAELSWRREAAKFPYLCDMVDLGSGWFCFGANVIGHRLWIEPGDAVYHAGSADYPDFNLWHLCPACYAKLMTSEGHLPR
jgi:hypothetical protein